MKCNLQVCTIVPSRQLRLAIIAVHVLAGLAVATTGLSVWPTSLLLLAITANLAWSLRLTMSVPLQCLSDGRLSVLVGKDWQAADLLPDTVVLAWLVVLRYRRADEARSTTIVVLPDCLDKGEFRRLRVWLKWCSRTDGEAGRVGPGAVPP